MLQMIVIGVVIGFAGRFTYTHMSIFTAVTMIGFVLFSASFAPVFGLMAIVELATGYGIANQIVLTKNNLEIK